MFSISKEFAFEAAHSLPHLPAGHQCSRPHGHSYRVRVTIESPLLDDRGFCQADYGEMAPFKRWIDENLDHRDLNEVFAPLRTTAENLSRALFEKFREVVGGKAGHFLRSVAVSETAKTWAEYRP